jgi:hypothetical protein
MGVGDHQLHPCQAAGYQVAEEARPAGAVLTGQHVHAEELAVAVGVDPGGDHAGHVDDPAGLAALDRQGVQPHVRVGTGVQRPSAERGHLLVKGLGELRDL